MQITLGRKLFFYTSILLLAVLLIAFGVLERNQARQWREYLNVQQVAFARFATPELLKHFRGDFSQAAGPAHYQQLQGLLSFNPDLMNFTIYSPTGRVLFELNPSESDSLPKRPLNLEKLDDIIGPVSNILVSDDGRNVLEVVAPAFGPSGQKVLFVRYSFSFQSVEQKLQEMRQTFLLIAFLASGCSLVLVALGAKRFTLPIHRLIHGVNAVSSGQLDTCIPTRGSDELAMLGKAFNGMAASLSANQKELQEKNHQLQQANADLQKYQDRMLRAERLAAVGQVAAGVSHEIDNPVGIILGYAELLLEEFVADDPRRDDLQAIIDECYRCKKITGGLLGLARSGEPFREPVDMHKLVSEIVDSLRPQKLFRQIRLNLLEIEQLPEVWADADKIRQILMNLLLNAAQALKGEGEVWLEICRVESQLMVKVHDNGPGIAVADQDRAFEPFFTTKSGGEGTGLGLSICRKLVEEHGGEISAGSSSHGGALLAFSLPIRKRDNSA
ncbi:sensor histidine kinase [Malonomonas rubra]|uniref:sensor histidine kinase n=1 Tax=Malonomonas rubra TaxID=57040 RepID=UPI0026EC25DA|nr:HAMP domain-containing sensor histidine kinase [Malonomonas rubra]